MGTAEARGSAARSTRIRSSGTLGRRQRPRGDWHFSDDGGSFLQGGERPRRTTSLISRLQIEARRRSLTDGAAVAEPRVLGRDPPGIGGGRRGGVRRGLG